MVFMENPCTGIERSSFLKGSTHAVKSREACTLLHHMQTIDDGAIQFAVPFLWAMPIFWHVQLVCGMNLLQQFPGMGQFLQSTAVLQVQATAWGNQCTQYGRLLAFICYPVEFLAGKLICPIWITFPEIDAMTQPVIGIDAAL